MDFHLSIGLYHTVLLPSLDEPCRFKHFKPPPWCLVPRQGRKSVVTVIGEAASQGNERVLNSTCKNYSVKLGDGGKKPPSCAFLLLLVFVLFIYFVGRGLGLENLTAGRGEGRVRRSREVKEPGAGGGWRRSVRAAEEHSSFPCSRGSLQPLCLPPTGAGSRRGRD